jgi:spore germination cell wall hydrolase CwlJ-like protein
MTNVPRSSIARPLAHHAARHASTVFAVVAALAAAGGAAANTTVLPDSDVRPALDLVGSERDRAVDCMAAAIAYEAGNEPMAGREAVAQVILNRLHHPAFPKTVCGVVYQGAAQGAARRSGCQFTFACDGSLARPRSAASWSAARAIAERALDGQIDSSIGQSTFYHANYVMPYWAPTLTRVGSLGAHIFYRFPGGAGLPAAFASAHSGSEFDIAPPNGARSEAVRTTTSVTKPRPGTFAVWGLTAAVVVRRGGTVVIER